MQLENNNSAVEKPELYRALAASRQSFLATGVFSFFINLLMLAPVIYMLEVYDRVLTSNSESTLLMLTLLLIFLFAVMGTLDWVRGQILGITGSRLEKMLGPRVFDSVFKQNLATGGQVATTQPLEDLLTLRQFLAGSSLVTFFDAPWLPIYIAIMYLFHPLMGATAVMAAIVLIALAVANERATRQDLKDAGQLNFENEVQTQRNLRNSEAIEAMGMLPKLRQRWHERNDEMISLQMRATRSGGLIATISKTFRMLMQSLMLGLGAYLAIQGDISGGVVIAGSLLLGRALAPINQLIGTWKSFLGARDAYGRLNKLLQLLPAEQAPMPLPPPQGHVAFEKAVVTPPGAGAPVIRGISFTVEPGTSVAIIGPSAAGKSTLVRAILGLYRTESGSIRLDGAEIDQWERETLGEHIGYLPQDVELLDGSVSDNIARFGEAIPEKVIAAARAAGVHDMILRLSDGYDTRISANLLSAGQRQRIGLARALYDSPKLVVLDEPNSNLDTQGDQALLEAVAALKQQGSTLIVVTHRHNLLQKVDKVMVISNGEKLLFEDPDKAIAMLNGAAAQPIRNPPPTAPLTLTPRPYRPLGKPV